MTSTEKVNRLTSFQEHPEVSHDDLESHHMKIEEKQGFCTLCRSRCGTINLVQGDSLIGVRPDPSHPTGKSMCMKGKAAPELVHSPHRLRFPMRRTRPKGDSDPGWERISWEEALSETASRLMAIKAESGAEAVAFAVTTPSGTPLSDSIDWIERFVRLFGSPNTCYATELCNWHKDFAHAFTFGCGMPVADYSQADLVMLWGHNPANTWLAQAQAVSRGRDAGARLLVVDPRPTALARQADCWLQVRPGTDAALALGLIHLLIDSKGYNDSFVRNWTNAPLLVRHDNGTFLRERDVNPAALHNRYMVWHQQLSEATPYDAKIAATLQGSEHFAIHGDYLCRKASRRSESSEDLLCSPAFELLTRASAAYLPQYAAQVTGIAESDICAAAALLASSPRVAYHAWTGIGQHTNATQTERAVASLYALLGCFDQRGGNRQFGKPASNSVNGIELMAPSQRAKALGLVERPLGPPAHGWVTARDTYRAILEGEPYRVRAMMAFGTNLPISQADTAQARLALSALEFHVHCDLFETPAASYADILLPVNTPWEREGLRIGFEIDEHAAARVQLRQRMVPPQGEARSDNEIVFDLACRLGMGEAFFGGSVEAGWNHMLEPLGLTVAQLRAQPAGVTCPIDAAECKYARTTAEGVQGFATQTGRVELYSELLLRHGQPPLPTYIEPADSPLDPQRTQQGRYPLVLTSAKNGYYCHSQHRSLASLRKRAPYPTAEISATLAADKHIAEGDWVRISTRAGQARFVARITQGLAHGVVVAEFGWWQACPELGLDSFASDGALNSNFNQLISSDAHDPISGSVGHRSFLCDIERDPDVMERQRAWSGWREFEVAERRNEAEGVLGIRFKPVDGAELPDYLPGQHLTLRMQSGQAGGEIIRAYSLTGPASVAHRRSYNIAVRLQQGRTPAGELHEGLLSGRLHRHLKVGDVVELRPPGGNFSLPKRSQQPLVLIAGGIGITPFISLLESLQNDPDPPEVWLYSANRSSATQAFAQRLAELAKTLPNLRVVNHFSKPLPKDLKGLDYDSAEPLSAEGIDSRLIERRARFYLCGPLPMMESLTCGLVARGVPAFDIFNEVFRSPAVMPVDGLQPCKVSFARSGRADMTWTPNQGTLLQLGEAMGLPMASGCRVGQCESCAVRLIKGQVHHLHGAQPDDPAMCLACQAVPLGDIVIDA